MNNLDLKEFATYVENSLVRFHHARLAILEKLILVNLLRNNDFEFMHSIKLLTSGLIINRCIEHHIYLTEKRLFERWLIDLAIFINLEVYKGWKSGIPGVDLEFDLENIRYIVNIKSDPNWANRSQIQKLKSDFVSAKRTLRTSNSKLNIIAINGCCYGRDNKPDKGDYFKYCGQVFWAFISGNEALYTDIIEPLGFNAKQKNDEYLALYSNLINRFTTEFSSQFCANNGAIDWEKLVRFNSGRANSIA
jgi:hypothetical protein